MDQGTLVDLRTAFDLAMMLVAALGGWAWTSINGRIRDLEKSDRDMTEALTALRVALPTSYVHKDEFKSALDAIHAVLRRIEDKLDNKVDKP